VTIATYPQHRDEGISRYVAADGAHQPLDLILARNLMSVLETPSFMVDNEGVLVFYNEAAGALLGKRFEETGRLSREQWNEIGPVDLDGNPISSGDLPLTVALREGRPSHGRFNICTDESTVVEVETSAVPLISGGNFHGAMVVFWPVRR
jgi:PAS domain-containing protein